MFDLESTMDHGALFGCRIREMGDNHQDRQCGWNGISACEAEFRAARVADLVLHPRGRLEWGQQRHRQDRLPVVRQPRLARHQHPVPAGPLATFYAELSREIEAGRRALDQIATSIGTQPSALISPLLA